MKASLFSLKVMDSTFRNRNQMWCQKNSNFFNFHICCIEHKIRKIRRKKQLPTYKIRNQIEFHEYLSCLKPLATTSSNYLDPATICCQDFKMKYVLTKAETLLYLERGETLFWVLRLGLSLGFETGTGFFESYC